ncbi:MAG: ATP-binding protein [Cruoricaptor ignavus]|nr:ATP-binding protein [Cruoricaptor ignavus]
MLRHTAIIFLLAFGIFGLAQDSGDSKYVDSLETLLKNTKTPSGKVKLLVKIVDYWSYRDTVVAFEKIKQSEKLAGNNQYLKAISDYSKAAIFFEAYPEKSQKLYMQAEEIFSKYNTKESYDYRAKLWHNYGALEQRKGDDKSFLDINLTKAIPFAEKSKNIELLASFYTDTGLIFNNYGENDKALVYLKKALALPVVVAKNPEFYVWTKLNYANILIDSKRANEAQKQLNEAKIVLKNRPKSVYLTFFYQVLSKYNSAVGNNNLALENINEGIKIAKELNLLGYESKMLFYNKFLLLKKMGKEKEATLVIKNLLETIPEKDFNRRYILTNDIATMVADFGNYEEAYYYLKDSQNILDSLNDRKEKEGINEIEIKFRTTEKERQLLIAENKSRQQKLIYIGTTFLLLGVLGFFFYSLHQSKENEKKQLALINQKKNVEVSRAIIQGEEHERRRIAKELHDGLGGRITGLKMKLETNTPKEKQIAHTEIVEQLDATLKELRQIAKNLMPESLLKLGLHDAISYFCENNSTAKTEISFYGHNLEEVLDSNQKLNIYRIVQELITNAIKHAQASKISVQVTKNKQLILIDVEDDGIGFDTQQNHRNLGLDNIKQRVKSLNGEMNIISKPKEGTFINITCRI